MTEMNQITSTSMWMTAREAATFSRVSERTILRAMWRGQLRAFRVNGRRVWRLKASDVDAWLEQGSQVHPYEPKAGGR